MKNNRYRKLCIKEISGNINEAEKKIFDSWLNESDENRKEYEQIKTIWLSSMPHEVANIPDTETEWLALNRRLENNSKSPGKYSFGKIKLKPAFAGAIAVLILFAGIYIVSNKIQKPQLKIIATVNDEHKEVHLPDGSVVLLNGDSRINFLDNFDGSTREVNLKGEAFFSVTKDGRPFIVKTENAKTTVLGTKFNVRSYGEKTEVFVKEGKVRVKQNKLTDEAVELTKGQFSSVTKDQAPAAPKEINPYVLSWIDGKLVFDQTRLTDIVDELERFYNTKISIENYDGLKDLTLTGTFNHQEIDTLLTMICTALNIDFEKQNDGYIIKSKSIDHLTNK
jgi:transmembrane sensor